MGHGGELQPAERRASDVDRQRAAAVLRAAAGRGLLDLDELEERLGQAFQARTVGQLAATTWDLELALADIEPAPPRSRWRRRSAFRNKGFQYHAAAYGMTNGFLLGTWAVTGTHFFWPFFPAVGWGIGLGMHALAAHGSEEKKAKRERQRAVRSIERMVLPAATATATQPAPAAPPARRFVAVLFTDVANSTRLTEALGDAEWSRVRARHRDLLRQCFTEHHGREVSAQGDGFLARFELPLDAVRCAVEVQHRLEAQRETAGFAPSVRIGIHAGDAVEDEGDLIGAVINLAARVTGEAEPGEILVTESVADHLDGRFHLDDRGIHTLKGVARPRHLLAVRGTE